MLGYKAALAAFRHRYSSRKAGLWMGGVECSGEEVSISECYHRGWANTRCPGLFYAGVMCQVTKGWSALELSVLFCAITLASLGIQASVLFLIAFKDLRKMHFDQLAG
jgi:hypothetical protein